VLAAAHRIERDDHRKNDRDDGSAYGENPPVFQPPIHESPPRRRILRFTTARLRPRVNSGNSMGRSSLQKHGGTMSETSERRKFLQPL
jgi:hypothetical protein